MLHFQVCANGLVCFNKKYKGSKIPRHGDKLSNVYCLAGYFADLTLQDSTVNYEAFDVLTDDSVSEDHEVIVTVKSLLESYYENLVFNPIYVFVATWENVRWSAGSTSETATFQIIFASNGLESYALYSYEDGGMNLQTSRQFIGVIANGLVNGLNDSFDGSLLRRPDLNVRLGSKCRGGKIIQGTNYNQRRSNLSPVTVCRLWYNEERNSAVQYNQLMNRMPLCPCVDWFLFFDSRFEFIPWWRVTTDTYSVSMNPNLNFGQYGKTCAFNTFNGLLIRSNTDRNSGSFSSYNRRLYPNKHQQYDEYYRDVCCSQSKLCHLYYTVRPIGGCYAVFPFIIAIAFGDPHMTTLDGQIFTFNGHGEYILVNVNDSQLVIQARTDRALRTNGNYSDATIFSAFAVQGNNVWVQVEINVNRTGVEVFAGQNSSTAVDFTSDFYNETDPFNFVSSMMSLRRVNDTLMTSFSETGVAFNVTVGNGLLQMSVGILDSYAGKTKGLMGNFNGDQTDDLLPRGAENPLPANSTERDIFTKFGETWSIQADESIFKYHNGKNHSDFAYPDYVPKFLDEADSEVVANATRVCGEGQNECIFDLVFTGNTELAQATSSFEASAAEDKIISANVIPEISPDSGFNTVDGVEFIFAEFNKSATFSVNVSDDGGVVDINVDTTAIVVKDNLTADKMNITVTIDKQTPITLNVQAQDNLQVYSPALGVNILFCTGCTGHGSCDYTEIRIDDSATDTFSYATCDCLEFWEGPDCELDFDACAEGPCSIGRTCTDLMAAEYEEGQLGYTCSLCPEGYTDNGLKCVDINECSNETLNACQQSCINGEGSFTCSCTAGYRLGQDARSCLDINECDEALSNCQQECTNTLGSYTCSCFEGFSLTDGNCVATTQPDLCKNYSTSCVNTVGCRVIEGAPTCFCALGYELTQEGDSCIDIDECDRSVCSQNCKNTEGSYQCSCYIGFYLEGDGTTCTACNVPYYGTECSSVCQCTENGVGCDSARGCICTTGWTGEQCETDIDECQVDSEICPTERDCVNTLGSYQCTCRNGYIQVNDICQDVNECTDVALNTCQQTCTNTDGSFTCGCNSGYNVDTNNPTLCLDFDECAAGVSLCEHICSNSDGRYSCECYFGYQLNEDRRTCTKVEDPCTSFPEITCSQICLIVNQMPVCSCNNGYTIASDNETCIDIDECLDAELNKCSKTDSCGNTVGGYVCACDTGYQLANDQRTCQVCDDAHYGENCAEECNCGVGASRCDNVEGCICNIGWTGTKCESDEDECASSTPPCGGTNTECVNLQGSYECRCMTGYSNVSGVCEDIDECSNPDLHSCAQICTNTEGSYVCGCEAGFQKVGLYQCSDINECDGQNECSQICNNTLGSYRCSCREGFKLDPLQRKECIPITQCSSSSVCDNGTCSSVNGVDRCECNRGYEFKPNSNDSCIDIPECANSPCDQQCSELPGSYACTCTEPGYILDADLHSCIECDEGRHGDNCIDVCECNSANTKACNKTNGSCTCLAGWTGTNCSTDKDECADNSANCPDYSNCVNTNGSFSCPCNVGYSKSANGDCVPCDSNKYGLDCANTCECVAGHVETCDPVDGTCTCKSAWTGTLCDQDVDECTQNASICNAILKTCNNTEGSYRCNCIQGYSLYADGTCQDDHECLLGTDTCNKDTEYCNNTIGSYDCLCLTGYSGSSPNCAVCNATHWGVQCNMTCGCNATNTDTCDKETGCVCVVGWTGQFCSEDVNECQLDSHNCTEHSSCSNVDGHFLCICDDGYSKNSNKECIACSTNTFGNNCSSTCDCVTSNALNSNQSCDHINGTCLCNQFWTGSQCEEDVDECQLGTRECEVDEGCHNTQGSSECSCLVGFIYDTQNNCTNDTQTTTPFTPAAAEIVVTIFMRFNYSAPASRNLSLTVTYNYYKDQLETVIFSFFSQRMSLNIVGVFASNISFGSIEAEILLKIKDNPDSISQYVDASIQLANGSTIIIDSQNITAQFISIAGKEVQPTTQSCEYFEAARPCISGWQCVEVDGGPTCQPIPKEDNFELLVGLGVGIPLGVIAISVLVIMIVYGCKQRRKKRQRASSDLNERDSFNNGFFPGIMPTKISTLGRMGPTYGPNMWQDEGSSEFSSDDQYRQQHRRRDPDILDPYSGQEPFGQTSYQGASNFSWDFLYSYLRPNERFEIQRPVAEQSPNRLYSES